MRRQFNKTMPLHSPRPVRCVVEPVSIYRECNLYVSSIRGCLVVVVGGLVGLHPEKWIGVSRVLISSII